MGMIAAQDCLLVLSNSGESPELKDLIQHARRFSIPLVGMSSRSNSTLMEHPTIHLLLAVAKEACPMGLAPTTSTTQMMALGDALAVALMERRGFSADDYRVLHPGGSLGKSLIRVSEIMHGVDRLPLAKSNMSMTEVTDIMTKVGLSCAGIVDETGQLIGIITDGDIRRHLHLNLLQCTAEQVMSKNPKLIRKSALAVEAVAHMNTGNPPFSSVFIKEDESDRRPVGILHVHDCLRAGIS
jgi:arabinose-5-phosphate isomerase